MNHIEQHNQGITHKDIQITALNSDLNESAIDKGLKDNIYTLHLQ